MGQLYFDNYSPVGDIIVVSICVVFLILVLTSYVTKTNNFKIFLCIVGCLVFASLSEVLYHNIYAHITNGNYTAVYIFRILYHFFLFLILLLYVFYVVELQHLELEKKIPIMMVSVVTFLIVLAIEIITTIDGKGFSLDKSGNVVSSVNIFLYGYIALVAISVVTMLVFRHRLYKRVMMGFYGTVAVAFIVLFIQGRFDQSSFTAATFLFPTLGMLYLIHSNPYNIELGAIDAKALEDIVRYNYERKETMIFMSLYMPDFDGEGISIPKEMRDIIRKFASEFFKGALLFQINNGHVILMAKKSSNPDYENRVNKLLNAFDEQYARFQKDYKIVIGETIDEISRKNEYISFINNVHRNMKINSVHMIEYSDVEEFNRYEYILSELADIYRRRDLRDSRVLAYCQPVFNIKTKQYDTAEALMRLKLPEVGLVYPDQFIPLAEEYGYIHVLTQIILQKTCDEIRYLMKEGYEVKRISINVSVLELKDEGFTGDVTRIIRDSNIPDEKVAIEITESQSEDDFNIMKKKIDEIKEMGIKLYLDDFGTGYSNMERIMDLPFDIIKFDRSLVIASDANERSAKMVGNLANMFTELDYSVLYEGVEDEDDEKRCINMSASYLQGYKYSKPIPIIELKNFFSKSDVGNTMVKLD